MVSVLWTAFVRLECEKGVTYICVLAAFSILIFVVCLFVRDLLQIDIYPENFRPEMSEDSEPKREK